MKFKKPKLGRAFKSVATGTNLLVSGGRNDALRQAQQADNLAASAQQAAEQQKRVAQQESEKAAIDQEIQKEREALTPALQDAYKIGGQQDEQRLNALGLLNSGALVEAKARRGSELANLLQANSTDVMRAGLQRQFDLSDTFREEDFARQLNSQALEEARAERKRRRRGSLWESLGGGLGALAGYRLSSNPYAPLIGYAVGSGFGGSRYGR